MNKEEFMKRMEEMKAEREKAYAAMDIDKKLMMNITALGWRSHAAVDKKGGQNRVLVMLKESGPMSQRDLTHRLGIQPGSASEILRKLEDAYLIERAEDENDRRNKTVKLTENGAVLADSLAAKGAPAQADVFSALDASEKETLLGLLEKIGKDWQTRFPMGPGAHMPRPEGPVPFGPGFGPGAPGFGPGSPHPFGREFHGDLDRGPRHCPRDMRGDLDRDPGRGPREFHGDMDRKRPEDLLERGKELFRRKKGPDKETLA